MRESGHTIVTSDLTAYVLQTEFLRQLRRKSRAAFLDALDKPAFL
jgi:hypothetical protein